MIATMGSSCSCIRSKLALSTTSAPQSPQCDIVVLETVEDHNSKSAIEEQIEHSKTHWSLLSKFELDADEVAEVSNVEVFRALQSHLEWSGFFQTFGKDGMGELVLGEKFAEGGQAELYDAHIKWNDPKMQKEDLENGTKWALKVFKKGTSLQQLQLQWSLGLLRDYVERVEWAACGNPPEDRVCSDVFLGILLEDGRFAFLMVKEVGDLRHLIDLFMLTTRENCGPFSKELKEVVLFKVALGVDWLHNRGIIHRDLKASNVLFDRTERGSWAVYVADYECSVGVVGTGFFRAPEILQACKDNSIGSKPELFTKESDAYSYGMLCYEILTGKLPFEDYMQWDFEHVLLGERPELREHVDGWIRELLRRCWQTNPIDRPSFVEILEIILANSRRCRRAPRVMASRRRIV